MGIPVETPAANVAAFAALAASIGLVMQDGAGNGQQGNISLGIGLTSTITGYSNTRIGYKAGAALTSGIGNTLIGENAGKSITSGINNTAIGWDSQMFLTTGQNNTSLGEDALKFVTGDNNTGVGYTAGYSISSGLRNSAFGPLSLYNLTTGDYNTAYGYSSGNGLTGDSSDNTIIGHAAFTGANAVLNNNTAIGSSAGGQATGSGNVYIGYEAGYDDTGDNHLVVSNRTGNSGSALLYGVFNAAVASQSLEVNGHLYSNAVTSAGWIDAPLWRDAAGQVGVRNGATAQSLGVYNTWTSSTIFERYRARWASNVVVIGPEAGGSGGTVRRVEHTTSIDNGWAVKTTADNTYTKVGGFEVPNLTAGRNVYVEIGVAGGSYNSGLLNFNYAGAANTANYISLGFSSRLDVLVVNGLGRVGVGETSPDYKLDVNGSFGFTPGASVTPVDNGDVVFELTDNTTLTVKAKGSDGTVRSGTVTLA